MRRAGHAPQGLAGLFGGLDHAPVLPVHLVAAFGERNHQIGQLVDVPGLAFAGVERQSPDPHELVLEDDLVADLAQALVGHRLCFPVVWMIFQTKY